MTDEPWTVTEYTILSSHIRGYSRGARNERRPYLQLAIKQYTPTKAYSKASAYPPVTLILCAGAGACKEMLEPFLLSLLDTYPHPIRSFWTLDPVHHAASYSLNSATIGDEPLWLDHGRDLLHMINTFQAAMPPPLVGISHSWGSVALLWVSAVHPRLFAGIAPLEPVTEGGWFQFGKGGSAEGQWKKHFAYLVAQRRKTQWASREDARKSFARNPFYQVYDKRVFDRIIQYNLREVDEKDGSSNVNGADNGETPKPVTLATPSRLEIGLFLRPWPPLPGHTATVEDVLAAEASIGTATTLPGFQVPEINTLSYLMRLLTLPILYVWGEKSPTYSPEHCRRAIERTGPRAKLALSLSTGDGSDEAAFEREGSAYKPHVTSIVMKDVGHEMPLEKPEETARTVVPWLENLIGGWERDVQERERSGAPFEIENGVPAAWKAKMAKL